MMPVNHDNLSLRALQDLEDSETKSIVCPKLHIEHWQIEQLQRVGSLIRGNWSGYPFDGRDIRNWIDEILLGENIDAKLKEYEEE